ncbi:MAG: 50S ribosomal protein L11 methyltransferase [Rhodospirillales bacterium]
MRKQIITTLTVPSAAAEAFAEALAPFAEAVSAFELSPGGDWRIEAIGPEPDRGRLSAALALAAAALGVAEPRADIAPLPDKDWLAENLRSFKPIEAGRFLAHPSHHRPGAPGKIALRVDAGEAFGTGEHETTLLCLLELDRIAKRTPRLRGARALDMGCGTGILALAVAKAWRIPVLAVDIAPEAARVAGANARLNGVAGLVRAVAGDGYRRRPARGRRYALIASNILQRPLIAMAPGLARHLEPGGRAVLSGFLREQAWAVIAAHRARGLKLERAAGLGAWRALTFKKP